MQILEIIGMLTLVLGAIFLYFKNIDDREREFDINKNLIQYNDETQKLQREYEHSLNAGKPIMTDIEFHKAINKILRNPKVRKDAYDLIKHYEDEMSEHIAKMKRNRKFAYQYEHHIFNIFKNKRFLPREEIIREIKARLNLDALDAFIIFNVWLNHNLVQKSHNSNYFEVGQVLSSQSYKLIDSDLTFDEWVKLNK